MADLQFPWEAFMQAVQQRNRNRQAGYDAVGQGLSSVGQTIGSIIQARGQKQARDQFAQLLNQAQSPGIGPVTETDQGPEKPPVDLGGLLSSFSRAYPGQQVPSLVTDQIDPLRQAQAKLFLAKSSASSGKPQGSYWLNPEDPTDISPIAKPGYLEYKTSAADAGARVANAAQSSRRNDLLAGRSEAWNRSIDTKQIDYLAKTVGFTPKMVSSLQNTAVRGQRGLSLLSKPNITWQELNAAGIDFAGIMQGGAPHVGEIVNSTFPNWQQDVGKWQTYMSGNVPTTVPPQIQMQMKQMLSHVVDLDTKFIKAGNKYNSTMIAPTIRGGLKPGQKSAMQMMEKVMTGGSPGRTQTDFSSMSDDELRRIAGGGK